MESENILLKMNIPYLLNNSEKKKWKCPLKFLNRSCINFHKSLDNPGCFT